MCASKIIILFFSWGVGRGQKFFFFQQPVTKKEVFFLQVQVTAQFVGVQKFWSHFCANFFRVFENMLDF
jgi:hypothetical protein